MREKLRYTANNSSLQEPMKSTREEIAFRLVSDGVGHRSWTFTRTLFAYVMRTFEVQFPCNSGGSFPEKGTPGQARIYERHQHTDPHRVPPSLMSTSIASRRNPVLTSTFLLCKKKQPLRGRPRAKQKRSRQSSVYAREPLRSMSSKSAEKRREREERT